MPEWVWIATAAMAGLAALFSALAFLRVGTRPSSGHITVEQISELFRGEGERLRQAGEEQARASRQELGGNLRGFQELTVRSFRDLGDSLGTNIKGFGDTLDSGIKAINERAISIATKLDHDMARMAEEARNNREILRQTIETKLDGAADKQAGAAKDFREQMTESFRGLGNSVAQTLTQLSERQKERLDQVSEALRMQSEKQEK